MEEDRRPRKDGPSRKHYKDAETQTVARGNCPEPIHEICVLCHRRILAVSSPNVIQIGEDLPDNICLCFFYDANAPGAANFENVPDEERLAGEENDLANVQVDDPQNNRNPVEEEVESNSISNNNLSNGEESKLLEHSSGSTATSPSELSFDLNLPNRRRTPGSNSEESSKNSPHAVQNFTLNGHASSLQEQSFDPSLIDQRNIESPNSERGFKHCPCTEKDSSSGGYPLSQNEQSPDGNTVDRKKSLSPSSGEDSKNFSKENNEVGNQSLSENLEQLNISEIKSDESFSGGRGEKNDGIQRGENDYQYPFKINRNNQLARSIPTELTKFRSENTRPLFPAPFLTSYPQNFRTIPKPFQPLRNPVINVPPKVIPYEINCQFSQWFGNPSIVNRQTNQMGAPGRFPVVSRPQMTSTPHNHRRPNNDGSENFSRRLKLLEAQDSEKMSTKKAGRIEDWLEKLENVPIEEASGYASGWSTADNEENEGIPPCPTDIFFPDEWSSTEVSEEETRRQMSERHPPRKSKK